MRNSTHETIGWNPYWEGTAWEMAVALISTRSPSSAGPDGFLVDEEVIIFAFAVESSCTPLILRFFYSAMARSDRFRTALNFSCRWRTDFCRAVEKNFRPSAGRTMQFGPPPSLTLGT